jgi:hypothetical protein
MKRINPFLTTDNPAPIPGCHSPVKTVLSVSLSLNRVYCEKLINLDEKNKSTLNG